MAVSIKEEHKFEENDKLFYHISKSLFSPNYDFDDIPPHAFTPVGNSLSTNWEKFCPTANDCLTIKTDSYREGRTPTTHGVGHFIVKDIKSIDFLEVKYDPSMKNKSHSSIFGIPSSKPKEPFVEMRKKLKRIFKYWDIKPTI